MSLQSLVPANTQRAKVTAVNAFKRFLSAEGSSMAFVHEVLSADSKGGTFVVIMGRFAMYLVASDGKVLARHSVMSYYRQVKNWLLDAFPQLRQPVEKQLLKMGQTIEKYCVKRDEGGLTKKAPACTKADLKLLMEALYRGAADATAYQDAALLCLMWYVFGRASDLSLVQKANLSLSADNVVFLRLLRIKTSEDQGLSLFPDKEDVITCPVHALALALIMHSTPSSSLLHLPAVSLTPPVEKWLPDDVSLVEAISSHQANAQGLLEAVDTPGQPSKKRKGIPGVYTLHAYVNRLLKSPLLSGEAIMAKGLSKGMTSHSFRRGGTQHANADTEVSAQWIFDRGSWNMTATNKAFAYVFNTTSEDKKVDRVLSGWKPSVRVQVPSLASFDAQTRQTLNALEDDLFSACSGFADTRVVICRRVLDVLLASLLVNFPLLKALQPAAPVVQRVLRGVASAGTTITVLLEWSIALGHQATVGVVDAIGKPDPRRDAVVENQMAVIAELMAARKRQDAVNAQLMARLASIEQSLGAAPAGGSANAQNTTAAPNDKNDKVALGTSTTQVASIQQRKVKRATTNLVAVWYEWHTLPVDAWDPKRRSDAKQLAAFMKLFLVEGFVLDPATPRYRDTVLELGRAAETSLIAFLAGPPRNIHAKGANSILKHMRTLHRGGALNSLIRAYHQLRVHGLIVDPTEEKKLLSPK